MWSRTKSANRPSPRPSVASMAAPFVSITMTISAPSKTASTDDATSAPAACNDAVLAGVRFQTTSGVPA